MAFVKLKRAIPPRFFIDYLCLDVDGRRLWRHLDFALAVLHKGFQCGTKRIFSLKIATLRPQDPNRAR
jgi:hypothetical protein